MWERGISSIRPLREVFLVEVKYMYFTQTVTDTNNAGAQSQGTVLHKWPYIINRILQTP